MEKLRKISKRYYIKQITAYWLICWMIFGMPVQIAQATPTGADVVNGSANINQAGNTTTVDMLSNKAVINWDGLDMTSSEVLEFIKAGGSFAVLNRILKGGLTQIDGSIFGNQGHIFIIAPNGSIAYGPTAFIKAQSFTTATMDIANQDFMNGIYDFKANGHIGQISNYGEIVADEKIALLSQKVFNAGTIRCPGGLVLMTAGDKVYLGQEGSDVVVEVTSVAVPGTPEIDGIGDVINEGAIEAQGGKVILAAGDTFSRVVDGLNHMSQAVEGGVGRVGQFGTINVDGTDGDAGNVTLTAADEVMLGENSLTTANGGSEGDGGAVIAYSPGLVTFSEGTQIQARGGDISGNGGFVEMSGLEGVLAAGFADLRAPAGQAGTFLFDPHNIWISDDPGSYYNINTTWLEYQLGLGNFLANTNGSGTGDGDITVIDPLTWITNYGLTLDADRDIYVAAGITNSGTGYLTLEADRHIFVDAPLSTGGNLNLFADMSGNVVGDMHSGDGVSLYGGLDVDIRGNDIVLGGPVEAGRDLTITGRDCHPGDDYDYEWGNVWAKDTLTAGRDITIKDTGYVPAHYESVWVDGHMESQWVDGHWEGHGCNRHWVPGHYEDTWVPGHNENVWVDASFEPGWIKLDGDVTAVRDISLYNDTYTTNVTGNGVTLDAGRNINLLNSSDDYENCTFIQGQHHLGLIAGNEIIAPATEISVWGSSLLMQQNPTLNTASYLFANQANTDLTLISTGGSVTSTSGDNAANKWKSIGAHASQNITLARSDGKNEITLGDSGTAGKSLWAENGYIDIDGFSVESSTDFADWDIEAGTNIDIDVVHGIKLGGDVKTHTGNIGLRADTDTRYGHDVQVAGNINSGGTLNIEGSNVDIQSAQSAGNMDIYAHGLYDKGSAPEPLIGSGDVRVHGTLSTTDGHIQITATDFGPGSATTGPTFASPGDTSYSATGTIYLEGNVTANGSDSGDDVILRSKTIASDGVVISAADDVHVGGDDSTTAGGETTYPDVTSYDAKDLIGLGELTVNAGQASAGDNTIYGNIVLGGNVKTEGDLTMNAERILVAGDVDATICTGGSVRLTVIDDMTPGGISDSDVDVRGYVKAKDEVVINSGDSIKIGGDVESEDSYIEILANTDNLTAGGIEIGGNVTTSDATDGDITIKVQPNLNGGIAPGDIKLHGDVDSAKSLTVIAQQGDVLADGKLESGTEMYLESVDASVKVNGDVKSGSTLEAYAGQDIELKSNVSSASWMVMNAGENITLNENSGSTNSGGYLTAEAGDHITLHGDATSVGDMLLRADSDGDNTGDMTAMGNLESTAGDIDIYASDSTIYLGGDYVKAADDVTLHNNTELNGSGNQRIEATAGKLTTMGTVHKTSPGNLDMFGGYNVDNWPESSVWAQDDVTVDDGQLSIKGNAAVRLDGSLYSTGDMTLAANQDKNLNRGNLIHYGNTIESRDGDIDMSAYDGWIALDGGPAMPDTYFKAGQDILLRDNTWVQYSRKLEAGDDFVLAGGKSISATNSNALVGGYLTVNAGDDIILGVDDVDNHEATPFIGSAGNITTEYDMVLNAGDDIYAHGDITSNSGSAELYSSNHTTKLYGNVYGYQNVLLNNKTELRGSGNQTIEAETGTLTARRDVDKTTSGDATFIGGSGIYLGDDVSTSNGNLIFENDVFANGTGSQNDQRFDADGYGSDLIAKGDIKKITSGDLTLDAGHDPGAHIYLAGDVKTHDGDLTFEDDVIANGYGNQLFDAGGYGSDLIAKDDITKVTNGSLTLDASNHTIYLAGDVKTEDGDLNFNANVKANGYGDQRFDAGGKYHDLTAKGDIHKVTNGDLTLDAGRDPHAHIYLAGDVTTHKGDLTFEDDVIANGCGNQLFDAGGYGSDLIAKDDIHKTAHGNLTLDASNHTIYLAGDVTTEDGDLNFNANVKANGYGDQRFDAGGKYHDLTAKGDIHKVTNGDLTLDAGRDPHAHIYLAGDVTTHKGDLTFEDDVIANGCGNQLFDAGGYGSDLIAKDDISKVTGGDLTLDASDHTIYLAGDVTTENGDLNFNANVKANGTGSNRNQRFDADGSGSDLTAKGDITKITDGDLTLDAGKDPHAHIYLAGDVKTHDGDLTFEDDVIANGCGSQIFDADGYGKDLIAEDDIIKTTWGDLTLDAGRGHHAKIYLAGDVKTENGNLTFEDKVIANGCGSQTFDADGYGKKLYAEDKIIKITAGNLTLDGGYVPWGYAIDLDDDVVVTGGDGCHKWGDLILGNEYSYDNTTVADGKKLKAYDDIKVYGDLHGEGDLSLYAGPHTIQLWGNVDTVGNLLLNTNTEFKGWFDQYVDVGGTLTANGYLKKLNYNHCWGWSDGSLYLHAVDDIILNDYVKTAICCPEECWSAGGGVSIISDSGSIYTEGASGYLNVDITGRSDQFGDWGPIGVDLPYGLGKAAIVIQSHDTLNIGPEGKLLACGTYYGGGLVDDRMGVGFLAEPDTIGGYLRDQGSAFDAAIYVGSTTGNVDVSAPVEIRSAVEPVFADSIKQTDVIRIIPEGPCYEHAGAMIVDAYDTVTFDGHPEGQFKDSLADGLVGDRLEVCSRITEWLEEAVGRLPFPGDLSLLAGYAYVMRGAGLGNGITDGRAWVLENRPGEPAPLAEVAPVGAEEQTLGMEGCPLLIAAASEEVGIPKEQLNVFVANAMADATDIQPCDTCARLINAASILKDEDGSRMMAMIQTFNMLAPADVPFSPEMATSIAMAFADAAEATQYASVMEFVDAFVQYASALDEIGSPTGDSVAFVMEKYGTGLSDNSNAVAFVTARIESLETFRNQ